MQRHETHHSFKEDTNNQTFCDISPLSTCWLFYACLTSASVVSKMLPVWRAGPGAEAQEAARGVLLHPDLADRGGAEEDAAHRPEHVHPGGPGAHLAGQEPLPPGEPRGTGAPARGTGRKNGQRRTKETNSILIYLVGCPLCLLLLLCCTWLLFGMYFLDDIYCLMRVYAKCQVNIEK